MSSHWKGAPWVTILLAALFFGLGMLVQWDRQIPCLLKVPARMLLNADAYTPGDFHQFFDDPRTRADYLKWAPLLLECEEYHAGNRDVKPLPKGRK